jgi:enamine deaminase RidA (YjgF/YER057c/UK114 family)
VTEENIVKRDVIRPWPAMAEHPAPFVPGIKLKIGDAELLFISGMGPLPPVHRHPHVAQQWALPDDAGEQARRALDKIKPNVETAGGKVRDIAEIARCFKDFCDQDKVDAINHEDFGEQLPCSTTVQVAGFVVPTMKLEFDCWTVIGAEGKP